MRRKVVAVNGKQMCPACPKNFRKEQISKGILE